MSKKNGLGQTSDGSSNNSRFYDNGADTTSSLSDNFYPDQLKQSPFLNGNYDQQCEKKPFGFGSMAMPTPSQRIGSITRQSQASCKAIYDFEAENEEELDFKEGEIIKLVARLDDNWLQGEIHGKQGRFPVSYVQILVPLP